MNRRKVWNHSLQARQVSSSNICNENISSSDATASFSSEKVRAIYDEAIKLSEGEVQVLGALCLQMLGRKIFPFEFGRGMEGVVVDAGEGSGAGAVETATEKTSFTVKLVGFEPKSKIKVIKEVRAICGLGLKEAKDLVDSAPKVLKKDLKEDQATDLQAQLNAVGAHIELE